LSSGGMVFLCPRRTVCACFHDISGMVLLPVRKCGRKKQSKNEHARSGEAVSASFRSNHL
jgi:hypothetical protein